MLVLTRKVGQKITIDSNGELIEIVVCKKYGRQVTIGVTAPRDYKILRDDAKKVS